MSKVYSQLVPLDFGDYEMTLQVTEAIQNYYYNKLHPGGFVYAILCNDFVGASLRADCVNRNILPTYAEWLNDKMPVAAWGSQEIVDNWLENS